MVLVLFIAVGCCVAFGFGYMKVKNLQHGNGGRNSTFQKFKEARKEAKSKSSRSVGSNNSDSDKGIQLPAVAISFNNNNNEDKVKNVEMMTTMNDGFLVNKTINTFIGKGKIVQIRRQDNVYVVELEDWKLANDSKVILYTCLEELEKKRINRVFL